MQINPEYSIKLLPFTTISMIVGFGVLYMCFWGASTSLKTVESLVPTILSLNNGDTITNPYDIANTSDNYFASIAETTKKFELFT